MFQSFVFTYNTKGLPINYKIVDDDFTETGAIDHYINIWQATIETYEKRKLQVGKNLMRAIMFRADTAGFGYPTVKSIIEWNKKYNPKFAQYEDDINKYLMLL